MTKAHAPILYLEGNVGVGKSTFLIFLKQHFNILIMNEPHDQWQNVEGNNLLELFFLNQKRWAYTLQSYVLLTRSDQLLFTKPDSHNQLSIIERSIYSGKYCFAQTAKELGWMNDLEWSLFNNLWSREIIRIQHRIPSGFIYLKAPADICLKRIKKRDRIEEKTITLEYLQHLEQKYDQWFLHKQGIDQHIANIPTLILDASENLTTNQTIQKDYILLIKNFINTL